MWMQKKTKKTKIKEAFLSLPEEEMFKYFDIFKKTMSGRLGKNLMNFDFPISTGKRGWNTGISYADQSK